MRVGGQCLADASLTACRRALNAIVKALDSKRKSGDLAVKKAMQSLDLVNKEINGVQKNADKTSQDLVNAVDQEEARQEAIAKLQKTVNKLAAQTKDKVDKPDMSELSAEQVCCAQSDGTSPQELNCS